MFVENQAQTANAINSSSLGLGCSTVTMTSPPKPPVTAGGVASTYKNLDELSRQLVEHSIRVRREFVELGNGPAEQSPEEVPQNMAQALAIVNGRLEWALKNLYMIEDAINS